MRPDASVSGTRCTRCTPDSNFSLANTPRPLTSATISLKPPLVPSLSGQDFRLPALLGGIALVHAEEVAGKQRGFVAAGAGADFEDRVVVVHRVLRAATPARICCASSSLPSCNACRSASASLRIVGVGRRIVDQRREIGDFPVGSAIGLDRFDHRAELGEFARQLDVGLRAQAARKLALHQGMAGKQRVQFLLRQE